MKNILGILVLGLLLSTSAYAKIVELKDCYKERFKDSREEHKIQIDTKKKIISWIQIYTDEFSREKRQPKIEFSVYDLKYFEEPYAKGSRKFKFKGEDREAAIDINLNTKKAVRIFTYADGSVFRGEYNCK